MRFWGSLGIKFSEEIKEAGVKQQIILNLLARVYQYIFCLHSWKIFSQHIEFWVDSFFLPFTPLRMFLNVQAPIVSEEISADIWIVVTLYEIIIFIWLLSTFVSFYPVFNSLLWWIYVYVDFGRYLFCLWFAELESIHLCRFLN